MIRRRPPWMRTPTLHMLKVGTLWLAAALAAAFAGGVIVGPMPGLDRRQFMAECVTARGTSDQVVRACAHDFPRFEALKAHGWRAAP